MAQTPSEKIYKTPIVENWEDLFNTCITNHGYGRMRIQATLSETLWVVTEDLDIDIALSSIVCQMTAPHAFILRRAFLHQLTLYQHELEACALRVTALEKACSVVVSGTMTAEDDSLVGELQTEIVKTHSQKRHRQDQP